VSAGPSLGEAPLLLLRIVVSGVGVALFYTAVAMGVSSLTTRRAVAAVATVLVLLIPPIAVGVSIESGGAPDGLALLTPGVATEYAFRVFGETHDATGDQPPIADVATGFVVAGLAGWILLGAAVSLVSYRRQGARR